MKPGIEIPTSLDLNDLTFSELAGLVPCDALSPAESSNSGIPLSGKLDEHSLGATLPQSPCRELRHRLRIALSTPRLPPPPTISLDLSTLHMQFDPELFSKISYQQPIQPDVNFQF
jgi:hypothetical protein